MSISREVLAKYITPGCSFIETGTRWGDTCIRAAELGAEVIHTVEADKLMHGIAEAHLADAMARFPLCHWKCLYETSPLALEAMGLALRSADLGRPMIVFLDAHGENYSCLMDELQAISRFPRKPTAILMDDRRLWNSWSIDEQRVKDLCIDMGATGWILEDGAMHPKDIAVAVFKK